MKATAEQYLSMAESAIQKAEGLSLHELAMLIVQINAIDDTLAEFRDLAGKQLKEGSGELMVRYRRCLERLKNLVITAQKNGFDLKGKLKCVWEVK